MLKKAPGGGTNVVHCHGKDKGKPINKKPMSRKKALKMHRAIMAKKEENPGRAAAAALGAVVRRLRR